MNWRGIAEAPKDWSLVFCNHPDWDLPMFCYWAENVRGHAEGRWYLNGEMEWLEPQPTMWLLLPESRIDMTTDPEEGQRQVEAMQPEPLKVGDKVRLRAGGVDMMVIATEDYGNQIVCKHSRPVGDGGPWEDITETHSRASLVRVNIEK